MLKIIRFSIGLLIVIFFVGCNNSSSNNNLHVNLLANCNMYQKISDPELSPYMQNLSFKDNESQVPDTFNIQNYVLSNYNIQAYTAQNALSNYVANLPMVGKWMMVMISNYNHPIPAAWVYWLGIGIPASHTEGYMQPVDHVLEPINFLFLVKASSESAANTFLINKLKLAGFSDAQSDHHTGGYGAYFNGQYINQTSGYPECSESFEPCSSKYMPLTFAKGRFTTSDFHFRALGPYQVNSEYYLYSASLSQESPYFIELGCGHMFISFIQARNELATGFINENIPIYSARLNNTLPLPTENIAGSDVFYTGDFQLPEPNSLTFIAVIKE